MLSNTTLEPKKGDQKCALKEKYYKILNNSNTPRWYWTQDYCSENVFEIFG